MALMKSRKDKLAVYKYINDLFEDIQYTKEGAYNEISIKQPDQPVRVLRIYQRRDNLQIQLNDNRTYGVEDPALRHRLILILKLQDNYDLMIRTTANMHLKFLSEFEGQDDVEIRVSLRHMPVRYLPRVELEPSDSDGDDEDSEDESSGEDTDSSSDSEDDDEDNWSESDSGLDSENDVQSDREENAQIYSDPESGVE